MGVSCFPVLPQGLGGAGHAGRQSFVIGSRWEGAGKRDRAGGRVGSRAAELVGRALEDGEQTLSPSSGILSPSQEGLGPEGAAEDTAEGAKCGRSI